MIHLSPGEKRQLKTYEEERALSVKTEDSKKLKAENETLHRENTALKEELEKTNSIILKYEADINQLLSTINIFSEIFNTADLKINKPILFSNEANQVDVNVKTHTTVEIIEKTEEPNELNEKIRDISAESVKRDAEFRAELIVREHFFKDVFEKARKTCSSP